MNNNCIKNLLKVICLLQNNSSNKYCFNNNCIKPFLGPAENCNCYNTRVITLYNKNGELFTADYLDSSNVSNSSSLFRIESINDDCCILTILSNNGNEYTSTNQGITININCICAIKCLDDIFLNNI